MGRWATALIASFLMLLVGPAASASGAAKVRFVNAIPGAAGPAELEAGRGERLRPVGGTVRFGEVGGYASVPAGRVRLSANLSPERGVAGATERLRDGARYTVVALHGGSPTLRVLRDGPASPGASRIRVIHAAPELGEAEARVGGRAIGGPLAFGDVAGYERVDPGAYAVSVARPGGSNLAARGGVPLTAGTSSTAFVVGSAGEPLDVVVAADESAAPRGAPQTGLGGLADDGESTLLLALIAALIAAALGAGGYLAMTGRSRGRDT